VNYGSAGIGSINQMAAELLNTSAGIEMTHVPYKGIASAITDLMGGQLQMVIASFPSVAAQVKAGKVRALAVTSAQKSKFAPELAPIAATVPGYDAELWWGVFAPAGTPPAVVQKLNAGIRAIADTAEMRERFAQEGADSAATMTPPEFATYVRAEIEKWRKVAQDRNIKAE
jgi:tripartite-type tricarboxylate transporter receptor subunit TctC